MKNIHLILGLVWSIIASNFNAQSQVITTNLVAKMDVIPSFSLWDGNKTLLMGSNRSLLRVSAVLSSAATLIVLVALYTGKPGAVDRPIESSISSLHWQFQVQAVFHHLRPIFIPVMC